VLSGTTPKLTVGDAGAEDTTILFDGNAQDFYVTLDDTTDDLLIGLGNAIGTTPAIGIDENLLVTVAADLTVGDTLDVDGDLDLDGDGFDVNITAGFSIDGDAASNVTVAGAGIDLTIESEAGRVVIKGDEAAADGVTIDADDAAGTGATINVGASGGLNISGGVTNIGGGSPGVAAGDNDLYVTADAEIDGILDVDGSVDVDGTSADIDVTGGVSIDGDTASNFSTAAQDLTLEAETGSVVVKGDEAVADAISLDANDAVGTGISMVTGATAGYALTGGPFDVNVVGAVSLDADLASNFNTAAGDITLEAEVGSINLKGDEAVADAVYIDANDAAGTGATIAVGATGGLNIGGGLTDIGGGTYATANGDNDLGVAGDLEVDGAIDADGNVAVAGSTALAGTLSVSGATTLSNDLTVSTDGTGGNANARNQIIGVPRIMNVGIGTMANGGTNTVLTDIGDSETPATDWTAIDGDVTMTNDTTYFRQGTASLKMAVAVTADDGDGCTNALASGDQDWTDDEGFGFWFMASKALSAGDITLQIHDATAAGGFTDVNLPAYTVPNVWVWTELDVTLGNNNLKDVVTDLSFTLSAAGAAKAAAGAFDVYFDFIVKWDVAEEESLGAAILQDGVMSLTVIDATNASATCANLTLYTDYFVHYQTGNDAIVIISNQSDADKVGLALIAY